ncbi:sugar kinase [Clostridia bacterium]|nr:sugar kinase [Clostridia bacterium]
MRRATDNKIILVKRRTRLQELVARYNTTEQARFYIEHIGGDFSDYLKEDKQYGEACLAAEEVLGGLGRLQVVDREFVPNFSFGKNDTVVVLGQDGLVANTLKYLDGQKLIGVNPDRLRWDGVLLPFVAEDLKLIVSDVFAGYSRVSEVTMAKAALKDGQILYGVNDLFIGQRTHVSSRYRIRQGDRAENQSSSGVIVSTGLGATGWLKSILAGAAGVAGFFGSRAAIPDFQKPAWNADSLYFTVREPFPSQSTGAGLVFGRISRKAPLILTSNMPENGVIFSDGMENDFIEFSSGMEAVVSVADKKGCLVV